MSDPADQRLGYRAYLLDKGGHVAKAVELFCLSDEQAVDEAKQLADGCSVELWERARLIARLAARDGAPRR